MAVLRWLMSAQGGPITAAGTRGTVSLRTNDVVFTSRVFVGATGNVDINGFSFFKGPATIGKNLACTEIFYSQADTHVVEVSWEHCLTVITADSNPSSVNEVVFVGSTTLQEGTWTMVINQDNNALTGPMSVAQNDMKWVIYAGGAWNQVS